MTVSPDAACPRCGTVVPKAFVGRICARCVLSSVLPEAPAHNPSAAAGLRVGARFDGYELIDRLGQGAFLARQIHLDRLVALKTVGATTGPAQARLRAVARLDHPHIVPVYDVGSTAGVLYFTSRYIEGVDLGRRLRGRGFGARASADLVRKVAQAIDCAHGRGVVHGCLLPEAILLDSAEEPHLTNFEFGGAGEPARDIHDLGDILREMLTARTPILDKSAGGLATICRQCSQQGPSTQYPSAGALAEDLGRFLASQPLYSPLLP